MGAHGRLRLTRGVADLDHRSRRPVCGRCRRDSRAAGELTDKNRVWYKESSTSTCVMALTPTCFCGRRPHFSACWRWRTPCGVQAVDCPAAATRPSPYL